MVNVAAVQDTLVARWSALWNRLDARGDPLAVFVQLNRLYTQPDRHYHTPEHVAHCLTEITAAVDAAEQEAKHAEDHAKARFAAAMHAAKDDVQRAAAKKQYENEMRQANRLRFTDRERNVIEAAIWFHDAVIIRDCAYSEVLSAALMRHIFEMAVIRPNVIGDIAHCIHRSTHGDPPTRDRMVGTFLDADLAILGQPPEAYDAYASRIRYEYHDVPDVQFVAARLDVFRSFLARDRIYGTDFFAALYEQHARENLRREIATLERGTA